MRFLKKQSEAIPSGIDDSYTSHRQCLLLQAFQNSDQPLSRLKGWNYRIHRQAVRLIFVQSRFSLVFLPLFSGDLCRIFLLIRPFPGLSGSLYYIIDDIRSTQEHPLLCAYVDKKGERTTGSPPLDLAASANLSMITAIRFFSSDQA